VWKNVWPARLRGYENLGLHRNIMSKNPGYAPAFDIILFT